MLEIEFPSSPSSSRWETESHGSYLIHQAALRNNPVLVAVLQLHPRLGMIPDTEGYYVTHLLARGRAYPLLLRVLEAQPNLADLLDAKGNTVLHYALTDPETIQKLLRLGVSPYHTNDKGHTPLMMVAQRGTLECFRVLYREDQYHALLFILIERFAESIDSFREWMQVFRPTKESLNEIVNKVITPLRYACEISKEIFIYLVEAGADLNTTGFTREFPVFWLIVNPGWWDVLERFSSSIDFSVRNNRWETPAMTLMKVVKAGVIAERMPPPLLKKILHDASPNTLNIEGESLFHIMSPGFIMEHADILFRKGIDPIIAESLHKAWKKNKKLLRLLTSLPAWHDRDADVSLKVDVPVIQPLFYSQYIHNMVIYAIVVYMENRDILWIHPTPKREELRITSMDTKESETIKFRSNAMRGIICMRDNLIDYVSADVFKLPPMPDVFSETKITFYILSLIQNGPSHTNLVLVNPFRKTVERFDPEGYRNDTDEGLDGWLWEVVFRPRLPDGYRFEGSRMKRKGNIDSYQMMDNAIYDRRSGDPEGYCTAWVMWYLGMRARNPKVGSKVLFCKSLRYLLRRRMTIRGFIRNFALWLTQRKEEMISSVIGWDAAGKDMYTESEQEALCNAMR